MTLTITGHAHGQTLLETAVLATVAVHAHDQAILILHAHLVVNILLNAAAKETLAGVKIRRHSETWGSITRKLISLYINVSGFYLATLTCMNSIMEA